MIRWVSVVGVMRGMVNVHKSGVRRNANIMVQ